MQEVREFFDIVFTGFGLTDVFDILLVSFVVYTLMKFIFETRAEQIFKGVLILVVVTFLSDLFNLHTLNWMCKGAVTLGAVAILIVFQPELRRALELMGRGRIVKSRVTQAEKEENKEVVKAIANAVRTFSREKTGALIVFERDTVLEDISETEYDKELAVNEDNYLIPTPDGAPSVQQIIQITDIIRRIGREKKMSVDEVSEMFSLEMEKSLEVLNKGQ